MCGIAGMVGSGARVHEGVVKRMLASMAHRGPDGEGIYISPSGLCVLGHRRLAILDLTEHAAQPMRSPDGRFVLTYNGECYNFRELREELRDDGEEFASTGDTEVVLRMLARRGEEALTRLNAMFALALWDDKERRLLLARDRFGQKPLYLARVHGGWLFASEVRALLASGLVQRRIDWTGVLGFLSFGAVQQPNTIAAGVSEIEPAASVLLGVNGRRSTRCYWRPGRGKASLRGHELREAFLAAVRRHLMADVPIGVFLSGGIDSSATAAAATRAHGGKVGTLTVTFPDDPSLSESTHALKSAQLHGTDHREVPVTGQDLLRLLPAALDAMDQPTVDGVNTFVVSRAARHAGLKAALTGLGGDELFGGYPSFRDVPLLARVSRLAVPVTGLAARIMNTAAFHSKRWNKITDSMQAPPGLLGAYIVRRRLFSSRQVRALAPGPAGNRWISGLSPSRLAGLTLLAEGRKAPDAVSLFEIDVYMGQMLLRDADCMGMANSLEIRAPFLDADFVHAALSLGPDARSGNPAPKRCFVEALAEWLPPEIIRRPKQGFGFPFERWMLSDLRESVSEGIESLARLGDPFCAAEVRALWRAFLKSPGRVGWTRPWSLFVLSRYFSAHRLTV